MAWSTFWIVIAVVALIAAMAQRRYYALQYLFFLRYPVLVGAILALLPLGACESTGKPIENLFVLGPWGLALTSAAALLVAWVVQYTFGLVWTHVPARTTLPFSKAAARDGSPNGFGWLDPMPLRLGAFALLALPVIFTCLVRSADQQSVSSLLWGVVSVLGGVGLMAALVLAALGVMKGISRLRPGLQAQLIRPFAWLAGLPDRLDRRIFLGESDALTGYEDRRGPFAHRNAVFFTLGTLLLYGIGFWLLAPARGYAAGLGALIYVLLLLMLAGWILPWFSFQFDKYRVPPEVVVVVLVALVYSCRGADHYYEVRPRVCPKPQASDPAASPTAFLAKWRALRPDRSLIVVAASGGGITASYWAGQVLTGLTGEFDAFGPSIALLSSTSGGSVGAMYYVDGYTEEGAPADLARIAEAAGSSSLAAMGWGLVYPDFLRVAFPVFRFRETDRGGALEQRWEQSLAGEAPTLRGWRADSVAGWRPAVAFNATLVETGERLILSTLDLSGDPSSGAGAASGRFRSLDSLYPGADMRIATAARLSATFPWVTPVARPDLPDGCGNLYHVADGGYYDNFGVVSAVAFLRHILPDYGGERILLLEIRASDSERVAPPKLRAGFRHELIGPADTMLAVRSASQLARNELDVGLIQQVASARGITIRRAVFELRDGSVPLSWHLSGTDREKVQGHWSGAPHICQAREQVEAFLEGREPDPEVLKSCLPASQTPSDE